MRGVCGKRLLIAAGGALAALGLALGGCVSRAGGDAAAPPAQGHPIQFEDITAQAGLRFRHTSGATGRKLLPETMGSGCALLDVDNDGWLDLFLVDSTPWTAWRKAQGGPGAGQSRLYRNLGGGRFEDVTSRFGIPGNLYGMGVAAGDFDNDGHTDLFLTALGDSRLLRNVGGRRFEDVTPRSGIRTPGFPTSAAWVDFNRDGLLDLSVCHYVQWSPETDVPFSLDGATRSYARPDRYAGEPCQLWANRGGGHFADVSVTTGIARPNTKALGVALCDFDGDGWVDLAVSNDTVPNLLFHNQGRGERDAGAFKEVARLAGMAVGEGGRPKAGMGIDVADYGNDGQDGILITNFTGEQISLYRRDTTGLFMDVAARAGIGIPDLHYVGFGAFFFDADLDGWPDILVANGHIQDDIQVRSSEVNYREPALLFRGSPTGQFTDVSAVSGALAEPRVARGAAFGDIDNDGDLDVLLTTNNGPAVLLRQAGRPVNHWLRVLLRGTRSNRDAIGATVRVRAGGRTQTRMVRSGSSYLSQSSLGLTFGLGALTQVDEVEVRWPNGTVESFGAVKPDRPVRLVEGQGH